MSWSLQDLLNINKYFAVIPIPELENASCMPQDILGGNTIVFDYKDWYIVKTQPNPSTTDNSNQL